MKGDSLSPPYLPSASGLYSESFIGAFALRHTELCILRVENTGDKGFAQLQVLHHAPAYYEYKDSNGALQQGKSSGKFQIDDLAATETREVNLWTSYSPEGPTVAYPDGKVKAEKPVEVTGTMAWLAEHSIFFWPTLFLVAWLLFIEAV